MPPAARIPTVPKRRWSRHLARGWPVALAVTVVAGGCVYTRLQRFGDELAAFDERCVLEQSADRYEVRFRTPVLPGRDVRWLGFNPTEVTDAGPDEVWTLEFEPGDAGPRAATMQLGFRASRLAAIVFPEPHARSAFPPDLVRGFALLAGGGDVSLRLKRVRSADAASLTLPYPDLAAVRAAFGVAEGATTAAADGRQVTRFTYNLRTTERERTFFRFEFVHEASGAFVSATVTWSEAVLHIEPGLLEIWLPSSWNRRRLPAEPVPPSGVEPAREL